MAVYSMKPARPTKPLDSSAKPTGVSAPAPPPIPHTSAVPRPTSSVPKVGDKAPNGKTYNKYGQLLGPAITPPQPMTTTYGAVSAAPSSPSIQPTSPNPNYGSPSVDPRFNAMASGPSLPPINYSAPPQPTQPIGRPVGSLAEAFIKQPQKTQPIGPTMSGSINGAVQPPNNLSVLMQMLK